MSASLRPIRSQPSEGCLAIPQVASFSNDSVPETSTASGPAFMTRFRPRFPSFLNTWPVVAVLLLVACGQHEQDDHDHEDDHQAEAQSSDDHAAEGDQHSEDESGHTEDDGGHAEDGHVELTETQFESAGIEVTIAEPGIVANELTLTGAISANADSVLHVTPRVPGRVKAVFKHLGESVAPGDALCVLESVELAESVAEYFRDRDLLAAAEETLERERELFASRFSAMQAVLDGAVMIQERILRREEELQAKALSTIRPLLEAEKAHELALLQRDVQLAELGAERDSRLLELELQVRTREIEFTAASNALVALGIGAESLEEPSLLLKGEYTVHSPGSGIILDRHVSRGEFVPAGAKVYVIEDLANVWFVASAFESQIFSLSTGQRARVSLDAFPGLTLDGEVSLVDFRLDPVSRSIGVRVTLENDTLAGWGEEFPLRPGMFGKVELAIAPREVEIVLPEAALVHEDAGDYVFVQVEPFAFERRDVTVVHAAGGMVEVTSGLEPGDRVAVTGTFLLKSAERQAELGGGHSH